MQEERPAAADLGSEYSRDNAARRYATRERHVSNGRESVAQRLERMHGGAAEAGGTRWGKRIALAVVIVVIRHLSDDRIKSVEELEAKFGFSVIGTIPNFDEAANNKGKKNYGYYYAASNKTK